MLISKSEWDQMIYFQDCSLKWPINWSWLLIGGHIFSPHGPLHRVGLRVLITWQLPSLRAEDPKKKERNLGFFNDLSFECYHFYNILLVTWVSSNHQGERLSNSIIVLVSFSSL